MTTNYTAPSGKHTKEICAAIVARHRAIREKTENQILALTDAPLVQPPFEGENKRGEANFDAESHVRDDSRPRILAFGTETTNYGHLAAVLRARKQGF